MSGPNSRRRLQTCDTAECNSALHLRAGSVSSRRFVICCIAELHSADGPNFLAAAEFAKAAEWNSVPLCGSRVQLCATLAGGLRFVAQISNLLPHARDRIAFGSPPAWVAPSGFAARSGLKAAIQPSAAKPQPKVLRPCPPLGVGCDLAALRCMYLATACIGNGVSLW
jgi:hypothetical protein